MSWEENLPSWVSKAPHIFALLFPFLTCGLNFSGWYLCPCRWPMTWGDTYHAIPWLEEAAGPSEALMENGRQRMRQVLRDALDHLAFAYFQVGSKQETHSFHHSNHNALYLLYHFFIFMSLNSISSSQQD